MHFDKVYFVYIYIYMQRLIITIIIDLYTIGNFFLKKYLTNTIYEEGRKETRWQFFKRLH